MNDLKREALRVNHSVLAVCAMQLLAACGSAPAASDAAAAPTESQTPAASSATPAGAGSSAAGRSAAPTGVNNTNPSSVSKPSAAAAGSGAISPTKTGAAGAPNQGDVSTAGGAATATAGTTGAAGAVAAAAGSGAAGGAAQAVAGSGAAGSDAPAMDLGKGDGKDVITIGDSWMNIGTNGGGIEGGLDRAMTDYRHYAVAGTQLLDGVIPGQYDQAKRADPKIATIIMTGGGNDVMFSGGCNTKEACTMFSQRIADGLDELWTRAVADGVTSTVYIQYSRNAGTAPADTRPDAPAVPKICTSGKLRCITINTTDLIESSDTTDGIHPTRAGCDRIAKRVLEEMEKAGARR